MNTNKISKILEIVGAGCIALFCILGLSFGRGMGANFPIIAATDMAGDLNVGLSYAILNDWIVIGICLFALLLISVTLLVISRFLNRRL
jgi:hypothetical protein